MRIDDISLLNMGFSHLYFKNIVQSIQLFVALFLVFDLLLNFDLSFIVLLK